MILKTDMKKSCTSHWKTLLYHYLDMFINPLIKTDWNDSYHVMLHRHEAPYTAMLVKKNMQKCCPSLRRVSPTVSQQLVFFYQLRTRIFGCRCASVRPRADADVPSCGQKRHTHAGLQRMPRADAPSCGQKRHTHAGLQWIPAANVSSHCQRRANGF